MFAADLSSQAEVRRLAQEVLDRYPRLDSFTGFLVPQYADTLAVVVVVTALIGELPLTLWLLIRGVNVERWRQQALASPTRSVRQEGSRP